MLYFGVLQGDMLVKRKKVIICGYYGFANAGDEAMLMAVIDALSDIQPNLDITVLSGNPRETAKRHGVKAVHRFNMIAIISVIFKADIVISGGGSLLQDVTSKRSIFYYLGVIQLAQWLGKPVMLYGHGIGPIRGSLARKMTAYICKKVDLITVRDKKSVQTLTKLGIAEKNIILTADPVMAMHPVDKHSGRLILRGHGLEGSKPLFGISAREWQSLYGFKQVLADVADRLISEYDGRVIFLPLQYPDDLAVSKEIAELMKEKKDVAIIEQRCSINEFLSIVGNMELLLSIRLHALIFGAVMRVPVIGISYDPKIDGFLEGIKATSLGDLAEITLEKIMKKIEDVRKDPSYLERQNFSVESLRADALRNAFLAVSLLDGGKQKSNQYS